MYSWQRVRWIKWPYVTSCNNLQQGLLTLIVGQANSSNYNKKPRGCWPRLDKLFPAVIFDAIMRSELNVFCIVYLFWKFGPRYDWTWVYFAYDWGLCLPLCASRKKECFFTRSKWITTLTRLMRIFNAALVVRHRFKQSWYMGMRHVRFANQTLWNAAREILVARIIISPSAINEPNKNPRTMLVGMKINARFF